MQELRKRSGEGGELKSREEDLPKTSSADHHAGVVPPAKTTEAGKFELEKPPSQKK